jgi:hypothetical protein
MRIAILIILALSAFGYALILQVKPYYNPLKLKLKSIQICYLLWLSFYSVLIRETSFDILSKHSSTTIFFGLMMTIAFKLNSNLVDADTQSYIYDSKNKPEYGLSNKNTLKIVYQMQNYIKN